MIGTALGLINGLIITRIGINPVITTLGMMALARGMASWFALGFEILKTGRITDQKFLNLARQYLPSTQMAIIPITLDLRDRPVRPRDPRPPLHALREERVRGGFQRIRGAPGGNQRAADQVQHLHHLGGHVGPRRRPSWWPSSAWAGTTRDSGWRWT